MAKAKIYMIVACDDYELPIAFADSLEELAAMTGYNYYTLKNCCDERRKLRLKNCHKCDYGKVLSVRV